jgi:DNA polymerase III alpha subunit
VRVVGWQVTGKVVSSKQGDPMEFVTLEDRTALIETVFFPRAYDRFVPVLFAPRPVIAEGRVQVEHDVAALVVEGARGFDGPSLIEDEALLDSPRRDDECGP